MPGPTRQRLQKGKSSWSSWGRDILGFFSQNATQQHCFVGVFLPANTRFSFSAVLVRNAAQAEMFSQTWQSSSRATANSTRLFWLNSTQRSRLRWSSQKHRKPFWRAFHCLSTFSFQLFSRDNVLLFSTTLCGGCFRVLDKKVRLTRN